MAVMGSVLAGGGAAGTGVPGPGSGSASSCQTGGLGCGVLTVMGLPPVVGGLGLGHATWAGALAWAGGRPSSAGAGVLRVGPSASSAMAFL